MALGHPPRLIPTPQPPARAPGLSYLRLLCQAAVSRSRVAGGGLGGPGAPGAPSLGLTLLAERGPVSGEAGGGCGLRGLPFQPQSACNWIHKTANWAGDAPALPAPPPPTHAAQRCPASCLATRICTHSYSTTTHNRKAFWLPPGCCLLFSTRFRRHLLQETCQDPHKLSALRGPATLWLSHCVRVRAELSRCLSIPSVFPSQASPTRRPVSTGVERPPRNSQHRALWKAPGTPSEVTSPWHTPGRGPRPSPVA